MAISMSQNYQIKITGYLPEDNINRIRNYDKKN